MENLIPTMLPEEQNRVVNNEGFSIVRPQGWDAVNIDGVNGKIRLTAVPKNKRIKDGLPIIVVTKLSEELEVPNSAEPIMFLERSAHQERNAFDVFGDVDKKGFSCTGFYIYIQCESCWYSLYFSARGEFAEIPPTVMNYLKTFRCDGAY